MYLKCSSPCRPDATPSTLFGAVRIGGYRVGRQCCQPTAHVTDNSAVLDAIARSGGRLMGVACIDEEMISADLAALKAAGIRGARFSLMSDRAGSRDAIARQIKHIARLECGATRASLPPDPRLWGPM